MKYFLPLLCLLLLACGNGDDDDAGPITPTGPVNATTVVLSVSGPDGVQNFAYRTDIDFDPAEGPEPPVVDPITLRPASNYTYELRYEEVTTSLGSRELTDPIDERGEDYLVTTETISVTLDFTPTDTDAAGDPIGLRGTLRTGGASSGVLRVNLRYQPDKDSPVTTGDLLLGAEWSVTVQ